MDTKNLSTLKIHKLTQAQYDRELAAGNIDEDALYLTQDDEYTNSDIDAILANKSDVGHTHDTVYSSIETNRSWGIDFGDGTSTSYYSFDGYIPLISDEGSIKTGQQKLYHYYGLHCDQRIPTDENADYTGQVTLYIGDNEKDMSGRIVIYNDNGNNSTTLFPGQNISNYEHPSIYLPNKSGTLIVSHVGMVIHSTTLDTMEKVIAIYGGTTWVKIEGKFLLGQSDSYAINSTGGEASHILTAAEMPSHTHTGPSHTHSVGAHAHGLNNHTHSIPALSGTAASAGAHSHQLGRNKEALAGGTSRNQPVSYNDSTVDDLAFTSTSAGAHTHTVSTTASTTGKASGNTANSTAFNTGSSGTAATGSAGSGSAHNNMPPYKTVYIWERTA